MTVLTYLAALNDIIAGSGPLPKPRWCPWCKGKGEVDRAEGDPTCRVCDGVGQIDNIPAEE